MQKTISFRDFQTIKRVAQACNTPMMNRQKVAEKIKELTEEYNKYDGQVASIEAGIKNTYGFRVEDVISKKIDTVVDTSGNPKLDSNGKPMKVTKYVPTSYVSYNEATKVYTITIPEATVAESTETVSAPTADSSLAEEFNIGFDTAEAAPVKEETETKEEDIFNMFN